MLDGARLAFEAGGVPVDLAGVQHAVAALADVDERGLHAGQHVLDPAEVDVADVGRGAGARDVVLDEDVVLEDCDLGPVALLADRHHAVDGLAPGQELRLGQDRRAATAGVTAVASALALGLQAGRALDALDAIVLAAISLSDLSAFSRGWRTCTTVFGGSSSAPSAPAPPPERRRRRRRVPVALPAPSSLSSAPFGALCALGRGRVIAAVSRCTGGFVVVALVGVRRHAPPRPRRPRRRRRRAPVASSTAASRTSSGSAVWSSAASATVMSASAASGSDDPPRGGPAAALAARRERLGGLASLGGTNSTDGAARAGAAVVPGAESSALSATAASAAAAAFLAPRLRGVAGADVVAARTGGRLRGGLASGLAGRASGALGRAVQRGLSRSRRLLRGSLARRGSGPAVGCVSRRSCLLGGAFAGGGLGRCFLLRRRGSSVVWVIWFEHLLDHFHLYAPGRGTPNRATATARGRLWRVPR